MPIPGESFRFVSIANPQEAQGRSFQRAVRSHAVKQGLQTKRRKERAASQHFRPVHGTKEKSTQTEAHIPSSLLTLSALRLGPEEPPYYVKLRALLDSGEPLLRLSLELGLITLLQTADKAKQALEPVFSVGDDVAFQSFRSVFRTSLHDPALLNATLLTATLANTDGPLNGDCLQYQTETIKTVRQRVGIIDDATITSTLGAILLLAGVEVQALAEN